MNGGYFGVDTDPNDCDSALPVLVCSESLLLESNLWLLESR